MALFGLALFLTLTTSNVCHAAKEYYCGVAAWVQVSPIQAKLECPDADQNCFWVDFDNQTFEVFDKPRAEDGTTGTFDDVDIRETATGFTAIFYGLRFDGE